MCGRWRLVDILIVLWLILFERKTPVPKVADLITKAKGDKPIVAADVKAIADAQGLYTTDTNIETVDDSAVAAALQPEPVGHGPVALLDPAVPPAFVSIFEVSTTDPSGWAERQIPFADTIDATPPPQFTKK